MRDRLQPQLNHIPAYYVGNVKRGSVEIVVALSAFGIWLLHTTIGKSVEEAYLKTQMHRTIVDHLSSEKRTVELEKNIDKVVDNLNLDNFYIDNISTKQADDGDILINVDLQTHVEIEEQILERSQRIDMDFVIQNGKKIIAVAVAVAEDGNEDGDYR